MWSKAAWGRERSVNVQLLDANGCPPVGGVLRAKSEERKVFGVSDITNAWSARSAYAWRHFRSTFEQSAGKGTTSLGAYECVLHSYAYGG